MSPKVFHFLVPVLCLFAGCRFFQSSDLQRSVRAVQQAPKADNVLPLDAIWQLLDQRGVPYKIVHFRYDSGARALVPPIEKESFSLLTLRETPFALVPFRRAERERVGIIYRDDSDRKHPCWYVDAQTPHPIWLPTNDVQTQVAFAMRRHVEIVQIEEFDGKKADSSRETVAAKKESGEYWNLRFKRQHGTDYDPASAVDRAKMQTLQIK